MKKVAIVGANGFIGKNISVFLSGSNNFLVDEFSSCPIGRQFSYSEFISISKNYSDIIFLSNSLAKDDFNRILEMIDSCSSSNARIIFFSTLSVNSSIKSLYSINKCLLEDKVKSFNNWLIVRPGFVFSKSHLGLLSSLIPKNKSRPIFLFAGNLRFPCIHIKHLLQSLYEVILSKRNNEVLSFFDAEVSIYEFLRALNIHNPIFCIHLKKIQALFPFLNKFNLFLPNRLQSFLSLYSYKSVPSFVSNCSFFLIRNLMFDYLFFNKKHIRHNLYSIRSFFYDISLNFDLVGYSFLKRQSKLLYHVRINEYLNLSRKYYEGNYTKKSFKF
jgi:hypothetical protein